jgi:hypothetical protein
MTCSGVLFLAYTGNVAGWVLKVQHGMIVEPEYRDVNGFTLWSCRIEQDIFLIFRSSTWISSRDGTWIFNTGLMTGWRRRCCSRSVGEVESNLEASSGGLICLAAATFRLASGVRFH